jgi:hypothetical protein
MCLKVKALVEEMAEMVITWIWERSSQVKPVWTKNDVENERKTVIREVQRKGTG